MLRPADAVRISPLVRRLTAPNSSPLTGAGTNCYILGQQRLSVIDPGPAIDSHIAAIVEVCDGNLENIFVTHTHADHSPGAKTLAELTGAKIIGVTLKPDDGKQDKSFNADIEPAHNEVFSTDEYSLRALHTPGHVGNHVCYLLEQEKMVFAGDHMMNGSTVVILPPSGDMGDYICSLNLLKSYNPAVIAPGHGEPIDDACNAIDQLIQHRIQRETKVYTQLQKLGEIRLEALVEPVYDDVDSSLHKLAAYSLHAHLLKLKKDKRVASRQAPDSDFTQSYWVCSDS